MNAICIIGSPQANGSTASIVDKIIEGMEIGGIKVKRIMLGQKNINYCKGCKSCYETRRCIQSDDMDEIIKQLFESDIVLIASPSYWGDITGQLKVFFDRSTPLCDTGNGGTSVPKGKIGISVAVRTGQRIEENMHLIQAIEHYFGHLGIKPMSRFTIEGVQFKEDFEAKKDKVDEAVRLGINISGYL